MLVKKENASGTIGTAHGEYESDEDGVFDVPFEVGERLIRTEGFAEFTPAVKTEPKKAAEKAGAKPAVKKETAAARTKREAVEKAAEKAGAVTNADGSPSTDLTPATGEEIIAAEADGEIPEAIVGKSDTTAE
jgi:hypothetical protein